MYKRYWWMRQRRRAEPVVFGVSVAIVASALVVVLYWSVAWLLGAESRWSAEEMSALGSLATGFLVPAVGGLAAWRALWQKEQLKRTAAWERAVRVVARTPLPALESDRAAIAVWDVRVNAPKGVALRNLIVGVADAPGPGSWSEESGALPDAEMDVITVAPRAGISRSVSSSEIHFGGRPFWHPHPFPASIRRDAFPNVEEWYKGATSSLGGRVLLAFSVDGYRFVRRAGEFAFVDEAARKLIKELRRLERSSGA